MNRYVISKPTGYKVFRNAESKSKAFKMLLNDPGLKNDTFSAVIHYKRLGRWPKGFSLDIVKSIENETFQT